MNRETEPTTHERSAEVTPQAHERSRELGEQLKRNPEQFNESEAHRSAEHARKEALHEALRSKEQGKERRTHQAEKQNASPIITKQDREDGYRQTMDRVRQELPKAARPFSKFIHQPTIEKVSDAVGNTVARPNAMLSGAVFAFVLVLALYAYAKFAGFSLQGSETIAAFVFGWILGIVYDFLRTMFTGKRS